MPTPVPTRLVLEFDDGSRVAAPWEALSEGARADLLRQPFVGRLTSAAQGDRRFVLIEWDDGWREVVAVDGGCDAVRRYRVLTRPESVGRLSLNRPDGYPELVEIDRRPLEVRRISFTETLAVEPARSVREGKKTEQHFALQRRGDAVTQLTRDLAAILAEEGIAPRDLRDADPVATRGRYERWRRRLGVHASWRQEDALDFVAWLLEAVAEADPP